jgi:hypothetical protein
VIIKDPDSRKAWAVVAQASAGQGPEVEAALDVVFRKLAVNEDECVHGKRTCWQCCWLDGASD